MTDPTTSRLPAGIEAFLTEMRTDATFSPLAADFETAFRALDLEGDGNVHAIGALKAISWVLGHRDRSSMERIEAADKAVHAARGSDIRVVTGWPE
jgi:hypothetical protein